jgi:hypothetical protein
MDEDKRAEETTNELMNDAWQSPPEPSDESGAGGSAIADEPEGANNIRDGKVRGTMHGGATKSEGQGG